MSDSKTSKSKINWGYATTAALALGGIYYAYRKIFYKEVQPSLPDSFDVLNAQELENARTASSVTYTLNRSNDDIQKFLTNLTENNNLKTFFFNEKEYSISKENEQKIISEIQSYHFDLENLEISSNNLQLWFPMISELSYLKKLNIHFAKDQDFPLLLQNLPQSLLDFSLSSSKLTNILPLVEYLKTNSKIQSLYVDTNENQGFKELIEFVDSNENKHVTDLQLSALHCNSDTDCFYNTKEICDLIKSKKRNDVRIEGSCIGN